MFTVFQNRNNYIFLEPITKRTSDERHFLFCLNLFNCHHHRVYILPFSWQGAGIHDSVAFSVLKMYQCALYVTGETTYMAINNDVAEDIDGGTDHHVR